MSLWWSSELKAQFSGVGRCSILGGGGAIFFGDIYNIMYICVHMHMPVFMCVKHNHVEIFEVKICVRA